MRRFFMGLLLGIFCVCAMGLGWLIVAQPHLTEAEAQELKSQFTRKLPGETFSGDSSLEEEILDWETLQTQYPDVKGWLTIPGTCVDYPVLQSGPQDPEHYLRRNYDHKWRMAGSLFFQYDCTPDSPNLVVFGHNMADGTMFGTLKKMVDAEYRREHSAIILQTRTGMSVYQVVTAVTTDTTKLSFNRTQFAGEDDFLSFAEGLLAGTGTAVEGGDCLLTLVTCAYDWEDARIVVVAIKN